jgi:hypothetical protein
LDAPAPGREGRQQRSLTNRDQLQNLRNVTVRMYWLRCNPLNQQPSMKSPALSSERDSWISSASEAEEGHTRDQLRYLQSDSMHVRWFRFHPLIPSKKPKRPCPQKKVVARKETEIDCDIWGQVPRRCGNSGVVQKVIQAGKRPVPSWGRQIKKRL